MRVFPTKITWSFIGHILKALPASLSLVLCKEVARYLHRHLALVSVLVPPVSALLPLSSSSSLSVSVSERSQGNKVTYPGPQNETAGLVSVAMLTVLALSLPRYKASVTFCNT